MGLAVGVGLILIGAMLIGLSINNQLEAAWKVAAA